VSTLTPSQLARKRANDREAQRAIRARTKEHIERLEKEVEELKSRHGGDQRVQELQRENKALQQELMALREAFAIQTGRAYPPTRMYTTPQRTPEPSNPAEHKLTWGLRTAYGDNLSPANSGVSSRASSFGQHSGEYAAVAQFESPYVPTSEPCDSWASGLSYAPSVVSSPTSSVGQADDYVNGYIPTSVPASILDGSVMTSQTSVPCLDTSSSKLGNGCDPKLGEQICYDPVGVNRPIGQSVLTVLVPPDNNHYSATSGQQHSWMSQQQQQPWIMTPSYYSPSPAI
jgi:hypothetical protein